jgi:hypothetical protein
MKIFFARLLVALGFALGLIAHAAAQGVALDTPLEALVRSDSALVGLNASGALLRSTDNGVNFPAVRAADSPRALYALAASGGTVIAMGDAGNFVRSTDGGAAYNVLGSSLSPAFVGDIRALAYGNSRWVAVGKNGTQITAIYSTDGLVWSLAASLPARAGALSGVSWTGSKWVAVGGNGSTGFYLTSVDGSTWTAPVATAYPLNAVASDGAGKLLLAGDAGTLLYSADHAASFTEVGGGAEGVGNLVSENLRSALFLPGTSPARWVASGDSGALLTFDLGVSATVAALTHTPAAATAGLSLSALAPGGTTGAYYFAYPSSHGAISLRITSDAGQLVITLAGARPGVSYHLETSTTLTSWSVVSGSTLTYEGASDLVWTKPQPSAGARVFYRVKSGPIP